MARDVYLTLSEKYPAAAIIEVLDVEDIENILKPKLSDCLGKRCAEILPIKGLRQPEAYPMVLSRIDAAP